MENSEYIGNPNLLYTGSKYSLTKLWWRATSLQQVACQRKTVPNWKHNPYGYNVGRIRTICPVPTVVFHHSMIKNNEYLPRVTKCQTCAGKETKYYIKPQLSFSSNVYVKVCYPVHRLKKQTLRYAKLSASSHSEIKVFQFHAWLTVRMEVLCGEETTHQ